MHRIDSSCELSGRSLTAWDVAHIELRRSEQIGNLGKMNARTVPRSDQIRGDEILSMAVTANDGGGGTHGFSGTLYRLFQLYELMPIIAAATTLLA